MGERTMVYMRVRDLVPAPRNPNLHQTEELRGSVDRHGFVEPMVLDDRTERLVAGHGRREDLLAREAAGEPPPDGVELDADGAYLAPVVRGWASPDDSEAEAFLVASNLRAEWEPEGLAEVLADLATVEGGLVGTGYAEPDLEELIAAASGFPVMHGAPELPAAQPFALDDLKPHPRNYQEHPEDQLEHLTQAITQHSFYKNIVVARDLTILAGHGAWLAARASGMTTIPAVRLDLDPFSPEALKIIAADNEISRFAARDDRSLTELLKEVRETDAFGLAGTGYDEMILSNLLMVTRPKSEVEDFDAAAEWIGLPDYEAKLPMIRLIINFETPAEREQFIATSFDGHVSKRTSIYTWSAHWPVREEPRESQDYQWETVEEEPAP